MPCWCSLAGFGDALRFHRCVVFYVYDSRILVRLRGWLGEAEHSEVGSWVGGRAAGGGVAQRQQFPSWRCRSRPSTASCSTASSSWAGLRPDLLQQGPQCCSGQLSCLCCGCCPPLHLCTPKETPTP